MIQAGGERKSGLRPDCLSRASSLLTQDWPRNAKRAKRAAGRPMGSLFDEDMENNGGGLGSFGSDARRRQSKDAGLAAIQDARGARGAAAQASPGFVAPGALPGRKGGIGSAAPLAERLRPKTLDEVAGQQDLVGPGKPIREALESGRPLSMILWGPPGVGKTTIARIFASSLDCEYVALSAVDSGVKAIREAVETAQRARRQGRRTVVFVDEIHSFNKSQQDVFLPFLESGLITLIGATTENPSFELNRALLSRSRVYALKPLSKDDLLAVCARVSALPEHAGIELSAEAQEMAVGYADGDARRLINALEQIYGQALDRGLSRIDPETCRSAIKDAARAFDNRGDNFYDQISALHKSVRGSHPNAALYWLARMLDAGAPVEYLARRIIRMSWEDIGFADPFAATMALNAAQTYDRMGSPEGELALANAVVYLACAPKSNSGEMAYNAARAFVRKRGSDPVPMHLRNAPTGLMKGMGCGKGYRYAHDEPGAYAAGESYMPEGLTEPNLYSPNRRGCERDMALRLERWAKMDEEYRRNRMGEGSTSSQSRPSPNRVRAEGGEPGSAQGQGGGARKEPGARGLGPAAASGGADGEEGGGLAP